MANVMQTLIDAGMNAFAVQLLAESFLKNPLAKRTSERGEPLRFFLPVRRSDCPGWMGVDFLLVAVPEGAPEGSPGPWDVLKARAEKAEGLANEAADKALDAATKYSEAVDTTVREKQARIYYQGIVYAVCNALDQIDGKHAGAGIVCGSAAEPSTQVQDRMTALVAEQLRIRNENTDLRIEVDVLKSALELRTAPCGHLEQYSYTADGGKHIVCLQCRSKRLDALEAAAAKVCEGVPQLIAALGGREKLPQDQELLQIVALSDALLGEAPRG